MALKNKRVKDKLNLMFESARLSVTRGCLIKEIKIKEEKIKNKQYVNQKYLQISKKKLIMINTKLNKIDDDINTINKKLANDKQGKNKKQKNHEKTIKYKKKKASKKEKTISIKKILQMKKSRQNRLYKQSITQKTKYIVKVEEKLQENALLGTNIYKKN